jgi:hypothetical protein
MAESFNTLAGLVQFNDRNLSDEEVNDLLQDAPLIQRLHSQAASNGTEHKYLKQTLASSAAFRAALAGLDKTTSQDTLVTDTLAILDGSFHADVALAQAAKNGIENYLERELMRTMRTVFATAEAQIIYGTGNDASGFAGLSDDAQLDAVADEMVFDAGGANASTQTSCFLLRSGAEDVSFILGNDGNIVVDEDPQIVPWIATAGASPTYPAYYIAVNGYSGFQIGGARSAARVCNIECNDLTSTSAFTDDDIYAGLSLFPAARQPNMIVMNRNALRLLRQSRTATNGTGSPAPRPTEVEGIPIIVTDQISSTEAVEV